MLRVMGLSARAALPDPGPGLSLACGPICLGAPVSALPRGLPSEGCVLLRAPRAACNYWGVPMARVSPHCLGSLPGYPDYDCRQASELQGGARACLA